MLAYSHCFKGVGRTGSLIACHIVMEKLLHHENNIDIQQTVDNLRKQRHSSMVKNEKQFDFIFRVMKDLQRKIVR